MKKKRKLMMNSEVFFEQAAHTFRKLPENGRLMDLGEKSFFNALPDDFQRKDAIALAATQFNIPERTSDSWLARLKSKKLMEPGFHKSCFTLGIL
jgi:hypothetical protein